MRTEYFSPAKPRIMAHRGLTLGKYDENTSEALAAAVAAGIEYLEIDVRASSDKVIYVLHDITMQRVAGVPDRVASLSSQQLDVLPLKRGGRPLRLAEALHLFPTVRFNLDLKSRDTIEGVRAILAQMHAAGSDILDRVLLTSFKDGIGSLAVKGLPVASSTGIARTLLARLGYRSPVFLRWLLRNKDALQIPTKRVGVRLDSQSFIRAVRDCGLEVHFWVINDAAEARRLLTLGADGIVSDRADEISAALAE